MSPLGKGVRRVLTCPFSPNPQEKESKIVLRSCMVPPPLGEQSTPITVKKLIIVGGVAQPAHPFSFAEALDDILCLKRLESPALRPPDLKKFPTIVFLASLVMSLYWSRSLAAWLAAKGSFVDPWVFLRYVTKRLWSAFPTAGGLLLLLLLSWAVRYFLKPAASFFSLVLVLSLAFSATFFLVLVLSLAFSHCWPCLVSSWPPLFLTQG